MAHSKLYSPSASHTWLACTASARLNAEKIRLSNPDADRGTRLHDFCYKEFDNDWDLIDFDSLGDDAEDARTAILAAWELQGMMDDPVVIQRERFLKYYDDDDCIGTLDLSMYNSVEKHLLIGDYKFGYNPVDVEMNPALLLYALGERKTYAQTGVNTITLAIIQPKVSKKPALFTISNADLNAWRDEVFFPAYRKIKDGLGEFCPGEKQCRWCPSRSDCPKLQGEITDMLNADTPEKELSWPERIRLAKLARLWADSQEESLLANLQAGVPCSGFKLVRGRSNRKWADEDKAAKWLAARGLKEKERYNFTVIGIPAAEKIVGGMNLTTKLQNSFNRLIVKPEGKLTYAPETDKREAVHIGDPLADEQAALDEL